MTRIALILVAAGRSTRFGPDNKLHAPLEGKPLISHAMENTLDLDVTDRLIVIREDDLITPQLALTTGFRCVSNPLADQGMGTSIACGVSSLKNIDATFIQPADMPFIQLTTYQKLRETYDTHNARKEIFVPVWKGQNGHPVLFASPTFQKLKALKGDTGARHLMADLQHVYQLDVADKGILQDIDTKEALLMPQSPKP